MLTRRQQEVREVIHAWYQSHGYAPTLDEIGQAVGIKSRSTVHQHIQALIRENYLLPSTGKRAYEIPEQEIERHSQINLTLPGLPLAGQIAAGKPIEAIPDRNDISPNELFTGPGRYSLKVRGDSMIDIGVMDGDYVVIQSVKDARNGDIVVALVDNEEVTLKRIFYYPTGEVELRPENTQMPPMVYPAESVQVQGRMVGLFRTYIYG
ncbi:MAG: repressor LexA [Thiothrix nivea]|nr:MAG: repressor LexA [Thiothrix nivea]